MKLNWTEQDTGEHTAEYAGLLCEIVETGAGNLHLAYIFMPNPDTFGDDILLSGDTLGTSLEDAKETAEEKLIEILKVWPDAYEELVK